MWGFYRDHNLVSCGAGCIECNCSFSLFLFLIILHGETGGGVHWAGRVAGKREEMTTLEMNRLEFAYTYKLIIQAAPLLS